MKKKMTPLFYFPQRASCGSASWIAHPEANEGKGLKPGKGSFDVV